GAVGAPLGQQLVLAADAAQGDVEIEIQGNPGVHAGSQLAIASAGVTDTRMVVGRHNNKVRLRDHSQPSTAPPRWSLITRPAFDSPPAARAVGAIASASSSRRSR